MTQKLIYDVGMNNGDDTAFYLAQGFRVVAVEADPSLADAARDRFRRELADNRLVLLNVGIAEAKGEAEFWICEKNREWNSFDRSVASRDNAPHHSIRIPTRPFGSILEEFGVPHYLKIDIEGQDGHCLTELACIPRIRLPRYLSWENDAENGFVQLETAHRLGYSRFKLIDQSTYGPVTVGISFANLLDSVGWRAIRQLRRMRMPGIRAIRERFTHRGRLEKRFGYSFSMGSSGPWGEDTRGHWLSHEEAGRLLRAALSKSWEDPARPAHAFWCDWHAAL